MENEKIKKFESKRDAIVFLNQLIVLVDKRMKRFERSINDVKVEIGAHEDCVKEIPTETYHRLSESIECNSLYLLNLFGDETKTAVSYKQFRIIVSKKIKQGQTEFQLDDLNGEITRLLNSFRDERNWSHHVPQSLFNSQINYMKTKLPGKIVDYQFSDEDIYVLTWPTHEIEWLIKLLEGAEFNYKGYLKVFQQMKKDYSKLVGKSMRVVREQKEVPRPADFLNIPDNSFKINTGKNK